jgi:AcrR family transcriptional regulator
MPDDRLPQLVACATRVFVDQGYARTQMADVAAALGVAKGTLYLYVESKEALFDLAVRRADPEDAFEDVPSLPLPTPKPGATLRLIRERLARGRVPATLSAALARERVTGVRAELEGIVRELYDLLARNRCGIKLIDRSAPDLPDLAALWFDGARGGLVELLVQYLADRTRRKLFRTFPDHTVTARMVLETVVFWAVHRHWDAHPQTVDESLARETVVRFVVGALVKE